MAKTKLLSLEQMEPIARDATRNALSAYSAPAGEWRSKWVLGRIETDSEGIFEIYIPGARPIDAEVISCAKVDRVTGAVSVEVFLDDRVPSGSPRGRSGGRMMRAVIPDVRLQPWLDLFSEWDATSRCASSVWCLPHESYAGLKRRIQ